MAVGIWSHSDIRSPVCSGTDRVSQSAIQFILYVFKWGSGQDFVQVYIITPGSVEHLSMHRDIVMLEQKMLKNFPCLM